MISNDVLLIVKREYLLAQKFYMVNVCLCKHKCILIFCQVCFVSGQLESLLDNSDRLYFPAFVLVKNTIWTAVN